MKSETISELAKALSSFQGKMIAVKKDATNPFYKSKYATLDTIWETIRTPLSENGLTLVQTMNLTPDGNSVLETTLYHTSGEWISGQQLVNPVKEDPQSLGSAISYARRYSLSALLGVVSDEDDDGNVATKLETKVTEQPRDKPKTTAPAQTNEGITESQSKKIHATAKDKQFSPEDAKAYMKKAFNKSSTKELTKGEASIMIEFLNNIKPEEPPLIRAAKELGAKEVKENK